jgi:hypothetical protein
MFVEEGVVGPVFGFDAEAGCALLEEDWSVGFWDDEEGNEAEESGGD